MPISIICGGCSAKLNAPDSAAGKRVKCPKCQALLELPMPEVETFDEAELEDEPKPAVKARPKPAVMDDDEEDEAPRPKRRKVVEDDEEDDEDRSERKSKKRSKKKAKPKSMLPLILGIGGGVVGIIAVGVVAVLLMNKGADPTAGGTSTAGGGGGAVVPNPNQTEDVWVDFEQPEYKAKFRPLGSKGPEKLVQIGGDPETKVHGTLEWKTTLTHSQTVSTQPVSRFFITLPEAEQHQFAEEYVKELTKEGLQKKEEVQFAGQRAVAFYKTGTLIGKTFHSYGIAFVYQKKLFLLIAGGLDVNEKDKFVEYFFANFQLKKSEK